MAEAAEFETDPWLNIQILNNTTLTLQTLQIGVNNNLGHQDLPPNTTFGWELGLANVLTENGETVYLLKTGQGGSTIAQWEEGNPSGYWATFVTRWNALVDQMAAIGLSPAPEVWYSQGQNDEIAGTNVITWGNATILHLQKIRDLVGLTTQVYMTGLPDAVAFEAETQSICFADPFSEYIDTADLTTFPADIYHWDKKSMEWLSMRLNQFSAANAVDWGLFTGTVAADTFIKSTVEAAPSGSVSSTRVDPTQAFDLRIKYFTQNNQNDALLFYVDTNNTQNYNLDPTNDFVAGVIALTGSIYSSVIGGSTVDGPIAVSFPVQLRMVKSGDDVLCSYSNDGEAWTLFSTLTGVLAGLTDPMWVKAAFAIPSIDQYSRPWVQSGTIS